MATSIWLDQYPLSRSLGNGHVLKSTGAAGTWDGPLACLSAVPTATSFASLAVTTVAGPKSLEFLYSANAAQFLSHPLAEDVTISGTITFNFHGSESNALANCRFGCAIYKVSGKDQTQTLICDATDDVEISTTAKALHTWTVTPTSTAMKVGDYFRFVPYITDFGTMATGHTVTLNYAGRAVSEEDTFVTFAETFTTQDVFNATYVLRALGTDSDVVTADHDSVLWTDTSTLNLRTLTSTVAGYTTSGSQLVHETSVLPVSWWTPQLNGIVLNKKMVLDSSIIETNDLANATIKAELAITNGDGSSPVVWATGSCTLEATTGFTAVAAFLSGESVTITPGQRLRLRLFLSDAEGASGPMASGYQMRQHYSGSDAGSYVTTIMMDQLLSVYVPQYPTPPGAVQAVMSA